MRLILFVNVALIAAITAINVIGPNIDLELSRLFYDPTIRMFPSKHNPIIMNLRDNGAISVLVCLVCCILAAIRIVTSRVPFISIRSAISLTASLVIGPGIVVNLLLKNYWGRFRPDETVEFGWIHPYTDWWIWGNCRGNCSFVSGEVAAVAWLFGPAMLLTGPLRLAALLITSIFTVFISLARIASGKHFLTDTLFAVVIVIGILMILNRAICRAGADSS